ncbi:signal peptidase II [Motilimonas cestriensis]|uniref:signal peptidase II n=1 Tax=Motilimonas cestriensis TaxID=2742685 RepID=UPI003DA5D8FE
MKKIIIIISTLFMLIGCDRATKIQAVEHLKGSDGVESYLGGILKLTYHENSGAFLSLGANLPDNVRFTIFNVLTGVFLFFGLLYIFIKPISKPNLIVALLVIGGGLGNFYDRVFNSGLVVDFLLVSIGPLRTGVFNVADIAIMFGLFSFMFLETKWGQQLTKRLWRQ